MPNRDGTGPQGMGAMTGMRRGPCVGGMGSGRGFRRAGRGFGFSRGFAGLTETERKKILGAELKELEVEKEEIEKEMKEL